ncbi:MAG: glycosyltransferase [Candidatus Gorgyraea atricola]|nr:glycosyltransferase [Candidatus Gorgyraea atricola]
MKIVIITEGGRNVGFGHITRCLGLRSELEKKRIEVCFIINDDVNAAEKIKGKNFKIYKNNEDILRLVRGSDCAIVDSYILNKDVYLEIKNSVRLLVSIDDNKRIEYPPGMVLNGAVYAKDMGFIESDGITYLLGPEFMPMRQEFVNIDKKSTKENIENILISFGGTDFKNMTSKVKDFTSKIFPDATINTIEGDKKIDYVLRLMQEADIAISAGGQTLYELARVGTPALGVCVADNQLNNLKGWEKIGFLKFCGWYNFENLFKNIEDALLHVTSKVVRKEMKKSGQSLIDGRGAKRVAEKIIGALN